MTSINRSRRRLLMLVLGGGLLIPLFIQARTLTVGPARAFASIRRALAEARGGDTILVYPGTYFEKGLLVTRPVYLRGIGFPILDGEHKYEVLAVRSDGVTVEGFLVRNSGRSDIKEIAGIKLYHVRDVTVRNNRLEDNFFGIYGEEITQCFITGNELYSHAVGEFESGDGIHCWKSDSLEISDNRISGFRDGIYFEFVTNSQIRRNISEKNVRYGLHFMFSHEDSYTGNTFRENGTGVTIMYTHGLEMTGNTFSHNWGSAAYGILMKDISDSHMEFNRIEKNTVGIYMEGSNRITIIHNEFHSNGWALKIQASCEDNDITKNNFSANSFDVATNGTLVLSRFNGNYWDKYEGYDLNRDGRGDVPYHPVSMYSMIVERNPTAMMLFRSFMVGLLDRAEKVIPSITPAALKDEQPVMKRIRWQSK